MPALQPPNLLLIKIETAIIKTTKRKGAMFMLKITYIEHSGFLLETENAVFLFDYYKGALPQINPQKPLFVFVSHKHGDHYNPDIFELIKKYPNIYYILSRDIPVKWQIIKYKEQGISLNEHLHIINKNTVEEISISEHYMLSIETLRSTDAGVAYLIHDIEQTYYHAGDLNLWVWEGETKQYNNNMTSAYYRELEKLKDKKIDVAFVPLDPRQEKDAYLGIESFLEYTDCQYIFPMHFWGDFDIISRFLAKHPEYQKKVMKIEKAGQEFLL